MYENYIKTRKILKISEFFNFNSKKDDLNVAFQILRVFKIKGLHQNDTAHKVLIKSEPK